MYQRLVQGGETMKQKCYLRTEGANRMKLKEYLITLFIAMSCLVGCGQQNSTNVQENSRQMEERVEVSRDLETEESTPETSVEETNLYSETESVVAPEPSGEFDFALCFAGDINLDDTWCTMVHMKQQENGILDCIAPELVQEMQEADVMCLNNEFTYSTGEESLPGKAYCFQAAPENVEILKTLGVDTVSLANNHTYDYGPESLHQTLDTLEAAGISYFGAGRNLEEAMEPVYLELDGKTVALVAASRAEKNKMTPQATETEPGILRCYDNTLLKEVIAEAKSNADYCVLFIHWGTEYSTKLEEVQLATGKEYLDTGADVVIGAHSHCLQGMEYYDGKPIIYSLGNYWFNEKTLDTMLINLRFYGNDEEEHLEVQVIPALQENYVTSYVSEPTEQRALYDRLEEISVNVEISDEGMVKEKQ